MHRRRHNDQHQHPYIRRSMHAYEHDSASLPLYLPKSLVKVLGLVMVDLSMPELLLELVRALPLVHNTHHLDTLFSFCCRSEQEIIGRKYRL